MLASEGHRGSTPTSRAAMADQPQFTIVRRGLDEAEVRSAIRKLREQLDAAHERERELTAQISGSEHLTIDETTLMAKLGEETARVLRVAHEAAADVRTKAETRAEEVRTEAEQFATNLQEQATQQVAAERTAFDQEMESARSSLEEELELRRNVIEAEMQALEEQRAHQQEALLEEARAGRATLDLEIARDRDAHQSELAVLQEQATVEAATVVDAAKEQGRNMVAEARSVRERILLDLDRRRRTLTDQIIELERSRDRLVRSVDAVRAQAAEAMSALERAGAGEVLAGTSDTADGGELFDIEVFESTSSSIMLGELSEIDFTTFDIDLPQEELLLTEDETSAEVEDAESANPAVEVPEVSEVLADADIPQAEPAAETAATGADALSAIFQKLKAEQVAPKSDELDGVSSSAHTDEVTPEERSTGSEATSNDELLVNSPALQDGEDEPSGAVARRDQAVQPIVATATKSLKRLLQDQQNVLLDALRTPKRKNASTPTPGVDGSAWWGAVADAVRNAATAGAGDAGGSSTIGESAISSIKQMVDEEGTRWSDRVALLVGGDSAEAPTRVTAAFREYRRESLDAFVDFILVGAFNAGVMDAAPSGTVLAWIPEISGVCPEADDNALEPTVAGAPFPTGQCFPPAHPGCRCVVAALSSLPAAVSAGAADTR